MPAEPAGSARTFATARAEVSRVTTLNVAVWVLAAETAALIAVAAFLVYEDLVARADTPRGALAVTVYAALMAGLLGLLAWSLWSRRRWARGPAIVAQMLLLPIGYYMITGGLAWLGFPVLAAGLCGAGALLAPATRAALGMR